MSSPLDMSIYFNGVKLPNYSYFEREYDANQVVNQTLGGTLYTDFLNIRRTWEIGWENLFRSDYDLIYSYYLYQYQSGNCPRMRIPAYDLDVPVMILMSKQKIAHNAVLIKNFSIYVSEQYAFS